MNDNSVVWASTAAATVLSALVIDETEPGHLQTVERNAEILFRILGDSEAQGRLNDCSETLAIIGELCREIERSKIEGRFSSYP